MQLREQPKNPLEILPCDRTTNVLCFWLAHTEGKQSISIDKHTNRFMPSISDEIKGIILKTLPSLTEDIQIRVITALESSGVESKDDLKYVQQDDIRDLLPVIQQRKLLEAFKMVAGDKATLGGWMISIENNIICEGIMENFITGLAAVFAVYYVFNLQYQEEAAKTLEFLQRRFVGVNPERGTKASQLKGVSKKTGKLVQKKVVTVNPQVATLIKNVLDFEWGFI
ncbi:hypothetical protein QQF64_030139 [Cirrhinus molitorella]|uniref:Uncharacterized protein n=1 Tax=Cirrhinus molitorella TaxID=172907 RepID=A0ABR3N2L2_9TELE